MIYCLFCKKKFKTKKAYKSHSSTNSHIDNEKKVKCDKRKFKDLFILNFCSFIHRYSEYKLLSSVYKTYINVNIVTYRDVGFKNLNELADEVYKHADIKYKGNEILVKAFDRYTPASKNKKEDDTESDLGLEIVGEIEIADFEVVENIKLVDLKKYY